MLKGKRVVELSHVMCPGEEEYGLEIETKFVDKIYPNYKRRDDVWYTLSMLTMSSHVGTHIEFPRHFDPTGLDSAAFPLNRLMGPACVLDFRHKANDEAITLEDVQSYSDVIQTGDVVFFHTGRQVNHNRSNAHQRPYVTPEATQWLITEKDILVMGIDATGTEVKSTDYHPNHSILLKEHQGALIEAVGDLSQLSQQRFFVIILPLKMIGLDSSPIRLIAIEDMEVPE